MSGDQKNDINLWKKFYTKQQLLFVIILFALSCWGTIDSFRDVHGDRFLGAIPGIIPGVLAAWQMLFILKLHKDELNTSIFVKWLYFTALLGSLPLIAANFLFTFAAWLIPANRTFLHSVNNHTYWEGSIGLQLFYIGGIGFILQLLGSILACIIIILPVFAKRKPDVITKGSILSNVEDDQQRGKLSFSIYISLAMLLIGFIIEISTIGYFLEYKPYQLSTLINQIWIESQWIVSEILYGIYNTEQILWLLGIVLIAIGILSLIWDVVQLVRIKK